MVECIKLHGAMTATLIHKDGSSTTVHKDNAIMNVGFDFVANAIGAQSGRPAVMQYIAVGNGTTPVVPTQTSLAKQTGIQKATYKHVINSKVLTFKTTFGAGVATGKISEAAVFNGASNGIMFDRVSFTPVDKQRDDILEVAFVFTLA